LKLDKFLYQREPQSGNRRTRGRAVPSIWRNSSKINVVILRIDAYALIAHGDGDRAVVWSVAEVHRADGDGRFGRPKTSSRS